VQGKAVSLALTWSYFAPGDSFLNFGPWWESARGELGWTDGLRTGVGDLDHQVWLAWLHVGRPLGLIAAWLIEHEVCLDGAVSPEMGPAHWLLVDGERNRAWVVIQGLGRTIVRRQRFHTPSDA
jgi:hypothetical protein